MKLHIENINVTLAHHQQPAGLLATLAFANASTRVTPPAIGEKWHGTEATYAGVSLSSTGDSFVHLLLWDDENDTALPYIEAVARAEAVNRDMNSHLPTRHQSITLYDNLQASFNQDYYHWTLTKNKSGKSAFIQDFCNGLQRLSFLSAVCRVRAVSEIPL